MNKIEAIEEKVHQLVELVTQLKSENQKLRAESEATRSALDLLSHDNQNAKQLMAEHREFKKRYELIAGKVDRALQTLQRLK